MTCNVTVNRGDHRAVFLQPCGRKVERDGMCKLHLRVEERREAKDREWREKQERGEQLQAEAKRLSERFGVRVEAHYSWNNSEYDGRFVVEGDWIRSL